jgi:hypothetical protein
MHHARKLTWLALAAFAALALTAPAALAQTEPLTHNAAPRLIVKQEIHAAADFNCPLVGPSPPPVLSPIITDGGCRVHTVSPSDHDPSGGGWYRNRSLDVRFGSRHTRRPGRRRLHVTPGTHRSCGDLHAQSVWTDRTAHE